MQRTQVLAVVAALVAAATATVVFAGGASAASWHVYEGDVYPGHAYALEVPDRAESVEFLLEGAEAGLGAASIGVYAPDGSKVGFYALHSELPAASIANPTKGRYVLYVYDVADGALTMRVNSEAQPIALDLKEVALVREDVRIGEFPQGKLDQTITTTLKAPTVFLTLLYEGSATDLDATVSSTKGPVVKVQDETATAFSPGVWTTLKGERTFDAANLEGTKYDVEVHAAKFEGRMVLTTLSLDLRQPVSPTLSKTPTPPAPAKVPRATSNATAPGSAVGPEFALEELTAVAFEAPAGKLLLVDPAKLEREAAEQEGEEYEYGDDCQYAHGIVSVFAPDDTLLATVILDHDDGAAEIDLPVAGEYVVYTHAAEREVVLAKLVGASAAPELRLLAMEEVETVVEVSSGLFGEGETTAEIDLERIPVDLGLRLDGIGAVSSASLENDQGMVASTQEPVTLGAGTPLGGWTVVDHENRASGKHLLSVGGIFEGSVILTTLHYLRDVEASPDDAHEHEAHDHDEDGEASEEQAEPLPLPASLPRRGPVVTVLGHRL